MSFLNSKSHGLREVEWDDEKQVLYNNSILALRELLTLREEGGRGGRITKLSSKIHITRDGLKYYFVEVTDDTGSHYVIEAYGEDAIELHEETMKAGEGPSNYCS
jgi:hypothetical protein